jgi:hypothetical protein
MVKGSKSGVFRCVYTHYKVGKSCFLLIDLGVYSINIASDAIYVHIIGFLDPPEGIIVIKTSKRLPF